MRRIGLFACLVSLASTCVARAQTASPAPAPSEEKKPASPAPSEEKKPASPKSDEAVEEEASPVEEAAVEEVAVEDEGPKPDAKHGVVVGKLVDAETKEDVIDGQCAIVGGKAKAVTDAEGMFSLKLEPGTYSVRCFFEGYKTARIDNVQVKGGQKTALKISLAKDEKKAQEDEVVVEVDPDRTTTATQMVLRKNAATVSDAVSAGDIAKTPDRNAADASKRVVGVSVVDGRFIYVRGLGDRYTNSLLNGTPLPSPEPDLAAIPLDIFPVAVLSDVTIYKSFTPDMPGDFAGGSVRISTRTFPQKFFFSSSFTGGYNTLTTFKHRTTYEGSNGDPLASDSGARRIPRLIAASSGKIGGPKEWMEAYGESLSQKPRRLYDVITGPNFSASAAAGSTHTVFGNPLGWIVSVGYGRRWSQHDESVQTYESTEDETGKVTLAPRIDFRGTRSTAVTSLSGLGALGYQVGQNHRFTLNGLYTANAEDDVLRFSGFSKNDDGLLTIERARWVQRKLSFAQLLGEHKFPALKGALLKWNGFYGVARRGEPNNVQSVYQVAREAEPGTLPQAKSGDGLTHFYSGQSETLKGAGLDWTQPLSRADDGPKLKAGALLQDKTRSFAARRFRYTYLRTPGQLAWLETPPNRILDRDTIGRYAEVEENTRTTDTYRAEQLIYAGYVMGDVPVGKLRFIGGARLEHTNLSVTSRNDLEAGSPETVDGFKSTDWLPALGVVYKLTDAQNLRLSATQTIARPQFREVARFDYADFFNAQQVTGNPDLKRSKITNLDLRWEWFPAADEVVAVSLFYKHFADPIESTFVLATSQTFRKPINTQAAKNLGVELEGRKNLRFLGKPFEPFTVLANLILVDSQVTIGDAQLGAATSKARPLQGQSPWVVNAALDWVGNKEKTRARVSYNVFGRRIDTVGTMRVPDTYEMPRHMVDLSVSHRLVETVDVKFSVENLFNAAYRFQTGDLPAGEWRVGQTFWLSVTHTL
jgi:outer membrane receptor protein involved in Fe transport